MVINGIRGEKRREAASRSCYYYFTLVAVVRVERIKVVLKSASKAMNITKSSLRKTLLSPVGYMDS